MYVRAHSGEWLIKVTLFLISLLVPLYSLLPSCLAPSASSCFVCLLPFVSVHASHCLSLSSSFSRSIILPTASISVTVPSSIVYICQVLIVLKLFGIKNVCTCAMCLQSAGACLKHVSVFLSLSFFSTYTPLPCTVVRALFAPLFLMHSRCV